MSKRNKIIYWVSTLWLSLGMVSTGIVQLIQKQSEVDFITGLGYPAYLLIIIGIWKILGVVVVLAPKLPLLKEWAYAGFFFVMSGAIISHIAVNNGIKEIAPAVLLLVLTIVSWLFRPADRKLVIA
ncbi:MAG TPA: DoxX family protein [Chitinophagales bacterium]|nr:DoxX family protein [Chitinophagales bacterium]